MVKNMAATKLLFLSQKHYCHCFNILHDKLHCHSRADCYSPAVNINLQKLWHFAFQVSF